jgi:hypothetical protein
VLLVFFFFFGCAFVAAHRIDWYGNAVQRAASALAVGIDEENSLPSGPVANRGCAIGA